MPKSKISKKASKRKNSRIIAIALIALVAVVFLLIRHFGHNDIATTPSGVKLAPATAQEKKEVNQNKAKIVQEQQSSNTTTTGKKQVSITITSASSSSVNAYVTGVFEDNGMCSATFTQGTTAITRTSSGFSNVSYTQCTPITPNLPNNDGWSVVVKYSSDAAEGTSQAQSF